MIKQIFTVILLVTGLLVPFSHAAFVHPGCLSTQTDLDRMAAKVSANAQPWKGSWDILVANSHAQLSYTPSPQTIIYAGGGTSENYMKLANDAAAAYQCALRYHGSGNTAYANKAVQILNAWASTLTDFQGDSNAGLRAGLYGWQLACAAELMRDYSGWSASDFTAFKNMMLNVFYPIHSDFLVRHNGTCDSHYWANWDLASMTSILAIGVLCDDTNKFNEAITYFVSGIGEGAIDNAVHYIHPNGLGQWQESGRDQGHNTLGMALMGPFCEIAWNQGVDLYGYEQEKFLSACEYVAKYNLGNNVPYVTYINCEAVIQTNISSASRGNIRAGWDLLYNHYVNRMGLAAPYTEQFAELVRPEGGGGNYGSTSGGYDSLGFTTLTHSLDPIASGAVPSELRPVVEGNQITLSWQGSAYANGYNVKRSRTSGGPYTTLSTVGSNDLYYVDTGLLRGATYYYVVSANNPGGESADSAEAAASADGHLYGTVIGTDGSWNSAGATRETVFDGSLKNYFDGPTSVSWAGLDLGAGHAERIAQVKYCPRPGYPSRMVGGKFQGSNAADFSSGVVDLYTIVSAPPEGVLTSQNISNANAFRYVRYLSPSGGYGNAAEIEFYQVLDTIPDAPTGLSAESADGQIALSWNAVSNAINYKVKSSLQSGGPYNEIDQLPGTNYVHTSLTNGTVYYYVVSSTGSGGDGADSTETNAVPSAAIAPEEYLIADHAISGSTNISLTASNTVLGHLYGILATDSLMSPDWQPAGFAEAGTGSNILFNMPVTGIQSNRFFKLDVQRQ